MEGVEDSQGRLAAVGPDSSSSWVFPRPRYSLVTRLAALTLLTHGE
jgi:hypothetical protein